MQKKYPARKLESNIMHEKKKYRTALSLAVSFFLAVFLCLLFLCLELAAGCFSEREFQKALRSSSYGAEMEASVSQRIKELFEAQELPTALVDQVLGEKDLYVLFHNYSEMRSGKGQEDFQGSFRTALDSYLQEAGIQQTENIQNAIEILAKEAGEICERALYPGFVDKYYETAQAMKTNLAILAAAAFLLSAACVAALLSMYHYKHRAVRYMAYSAIAATAFNISGLIYLGSASVLQISGVGPDYYQDFLEQYQAQALAPWYLVSGMGVVLAVLLLLLMKRLKHTIK